MDQFQMFLPLLKVDEEQRLVYGRAVQEIYDRTGEVMDYESSAPNFKKWSSDAEMRTSWLPPENRSKGNVRVMHKKDHVGGKLVDLTFNDPEKAVDVVAYISDDATWKGIMNGVYSGFSVGGSYGKRWVDPKNPRMTRYTAQPAELSIVDAPAMQTATFTLVKADGTEETRSFNRLARLQHAAESIIEGEKMTEEILQKDIGSLLHQINQALTLAADEIGKDSAKAKKMLMSLLAGLEGSDNSTSISTSSSEPEAPKASGDGTGSGSDEKSTSSSESSMPTPKSTASEESESAPSMSKAETTAENPLMLALASQIEALTKSVELLTAKQVAITVEKNLPANDLLKMLLAAQPPKGDPVMDAYLSGDKNALLKAAQVAGSVERPDLDAVYRKVDMAFEEATLPIFTRMMIAQGISIHGPDLQ